MEIDQEEADLLSTSISNVMQEFDITIDPKTAAIIGLISASSQVYGPRAIAMGMRKSREAEQRKKERQKKAQESGGGISSADHIEMMDMTGLGGMQ